MSDESGYQMTRGGGAGNTQVVLDHGNISPRESWCKITAG